MKSAIYTLITYIIGAVGFTVLLKPDKDNWPMVLIAAVFPTMLVYMWRNRKTLRWQGAGQHDAKNWDHLKFDPQDMSRPESILPGGASDPHRFD